MHLTKRLKGFVAVRGAQENLSASKMGLRILEWWVISGAPCVTDAGRKVTPIPYDPDLAWENVLGLPTEEILEAAPGPAAARFRR